jgi:hypothetical protein
MARPSTLYLSLLLLLGLLLLALQIHSRCNLADDTRRLAQAARLATRFSLTDLALCTEARYSRHLSQADRHAAFQDHPGALEHFPSGSLLPPPDR